MCGRLSFASPHRLYASPPLAYLEHKVAPEATYENTYAKALKWLINVSDKAFEVALVRDEISMEG